MQWRPMPLSLFDVKHWNDLEVKKKIKRRGVCVLCRGKKKKKSRSDPSRSVGRMTSGDGDAGAAVEMHAVEAQADLSLSLL